MPGLRVAIVGAGLMGRWHAYYAARAGAAVTAIVDPVADTTAALQRRFPAARGFADLAACLAANAADVVHICTGLDSHVPLTELALKAGKHVLVEKPLAPSASETENLLALASTHGVRLGVVHQFPFQRGFQQLLQNLDGLGELVCIRYDTCSTGGENRSDAARRAILLDILPHPFSLIDSLLRGGGVDPAWEIVQFSCDDLILAGRHNQVHLQIGISLRGRPARNDLHVVGTQATAHVDLFHGYQFRDLTGTSRTAKVLRPFASGLKLLVASGWNLVLRTARRESAYPGLRELIAAFHASIRNNSPAPFSAQQILAIARQVDQVRNQFTEPRP